MSSTTTNDFQLGSDISSITKSAKDSIFGDSAKIKNIINGGYVEKYYYQSDSVQNGSKEPLPKSFKIRRPRSTNGSREEGVSSRNSENFKKTSRKPKGFKKTNRIIKKMYDRNFGYSTPFIDSSLKPFIDRVPSNPVSGGKIKIPTSDIRISDSETVKRYCSDSRRLSFNSAKVWISAGIRAAYDLGIFTSDSRKRKKPIQIRQCIDGVIKNTNSGFPKFEKKNSHPAIRDAYNWLVRVMKNPNFFNVVQKNLTFRYVEGKIPDDLMANPAYIFHRFQAVMTEDMVDFVMKIRQVWCVPFRIVALEYRYFYPFLKAAKEHAMNTTRPVYGTGMRAFEISKLLVSPLRNMLQGKPNEFIYSMDYSKFDQTIPSWAIDIFFSIIQSQIKFTTERDLKVFKNLRLYIKHTPFVHEGKIYFQKRGMCSGSLITNLFDTWWNLTIWYFVDILENNFDKETLERLGLQIDLIEKLDYSKVDLENKNIVSPKSVLVFGDDTLIYAGSQTIGLHKLVCLHFGMKSSHKKPVNNAKDDIYFLGRWWNSFNEPIQRDSWFCVHLGIRTKSFSKQLIPVTGEKLTLSRVLSICLPYANGLKFLKDYLWDWKPLQDYFRDKFGFYDTRDYPDQGYGFVPYEKSLSWRNFG